MRFFKKYFFLIFVGTVGLAVYAAETPSSILERIKLSAQRAQASCNEKIHFDTYAFDRCIEQLAQKYKKHEPERLGTLYAGFAIGLSNTRTGMPGSEETAKFFYWRYQPLQKKLGIDDMSLCSIMPTDCKIRVAQTQEIAKAQRPKKPAASKPSVNHEH